MEFVRSTVRKAEDMIPTTYHHTIYEIEGNIQELAAVENSELLDKKVVRRTTEASLVLDKEMTLEELCKEYNAILTKFNQRQNQNYWERLNQPKNKKLRLKIPSEKKPQ